MEARLFALQRLTAMVMAPFVLVHVAVVLYAVRGGLTAAELLARTQGNWGWIAFYTLFVVSVGIHVPIGLRNILVEWTGLGRRSATTLCAAFGLLLLGLGLRAVIAVGGLGS
jgi:fumarate reductase subunit C